PPALPVERRARGPGPRSPPAPLPSWTPILTAIPRRADNPGRRRPEAALAPDSRQDLLGVTLDGDEGLGATAGLDGDTFEIDQVGAVLASPPQCARSQSAHRRAPGQRPPLGSSAREQGDEVIDREAALGGMPQLPAGDEVVVVQASGARVGEVAGLLQIVDDPVGGALVDLAAGRDVPHRDDGVRATSTRTRAWLARNVQVTRGPAGSSIAPAYPPPTGLDPTCRSTDSGPGAASDTVSPAPARRPASGCLGTRTWCPSTATTPASTPRAATSWRRCC